MAGRYYFINTTRKLTLADNGRIADNPWLRLKGLLGTKTLPDGQGLLIEPCQSIHTFFMAYPIDVLFLDKRFRIVHLYKAMRPNRASRIVFKAHSVIELPPGIVDRSGTAVGDVVSVEAAG